MWLPPSSPKGPNLIEGSQVAIELARWEGAWIRTLVPHRSLGSTSPEPPRSSLGTDQIPVPRPGEERLFATP